MLMRALFLAGVISTQLITTPAVGHEFWIEPKAHTVAPGDAIEADLKVGERFQGAPLIFNPNTLRRRDIASAEGLVEFGGRLGDRPAVRAEAPEGLAVIVVTTSDSRLTYNEFEKFEAFVEHKGESWVLDAHRARGLPETGFAEAFSRYGKSLVAVGDAVGADRRFGLETEIVALKNPYTEDVSAGLPVEVLYQGAPRSGAKLEIFEMDPDGGVTVTATQTGPDGRALVAVRPGYRYMLDSVVLREPDASLAEASRVVWESLWANLTFGIPD